MEIPSVDDIINGTVTKAGPFSDTQMYAIVCDVGLKLKQESDWIKGMYLGNDAVWEPFHDAWLAQANNACGFIVDSCTPEQAVASMAVFVQSFRLPFYVNQMPNFNRFANVCRDIAMGNDSPRFIETGEIVPIKEVDTEESRTKGMESYVREFFKKYPGNSLAICLKAALDQYAARK